MPYHRPRFRDVCARPLLLAVLLSAGAHAGVLGLTAMTLLPHLPAVELVRVALRPGGAENRRPGPTTPAPPAGARHRSSPKRRRRCCNRTSCHRRDRPSCPPQARNVAPASAPRIVARPSAASPPTRRPTTGATDTGIVPNADTSTAAVAAVGTATAPARAQRGAGNRPGGGTDLGDQRAACVFCPEPVYPLIARRRGWQGTVNVGLVLLADGRVERASLRHSSGFDVLDREALEVARRSRFRLADVGGNAVVGEIKYRFELVGGD